MPLILVPLFFITAVLYASVGFGGGSTYNALLWLFDVDYRYLPALALICNIIVVSGGSFRHWREQNIPFRALMPFLAASIPAAFVGGRLEISEQTFVGLLGVSLFLSGLRLAFQSSQTSVPSARNELSTGASFAIGGGVGLLSGLVGIGGGIFLAPILYLINWDSPRRIAAACSIFILVNSLAGLTGQLWKLRDIQELSAIASFWPLLMAVFIGGQIGSWASSRALQPMLIKRLTAILILYVSARLLYQWLTMVT